MHLVRSALVFGLGLVTIGCGGGGGASGTGGAGVCPAGSEGCACYGNDTCNGALNCYSHLCVSLTASGGASGSGGQVATGGAAGGLTASGGAAGGSPGSGGQIATGGSPGTGGQGGDLGLGGSPGTGGSGSCQSQPLTFVPRAPTVLILADRGGSEFATATTGTFFNVKTAVEGAIAGVQAQDRLGLAVYVGDHSSGSCQLNYDAVPIALSNAFAIGAGYDALGPLQPYPTAKADTPLEEAIPMAEAALNADSGNGGKILLLITSGHADFCDDSLADCADDAVTYQLQQMYAATPSIETLVVGLPVDGDDPDGAKVLTNFANAGAGQPVVAPTAGLKYDCDALQGGGAYSWANLFAASGNTTSVATYSSTEGSAPLYNAASASATDVETAVNAALAAAKSCAFDLAQLSIDPTKLGEVTVSVSGVKVPQDASLGWSMPMPTELVLNGLACATFRQPNASFSFSAPCDAIRTN